MTELLIEGEWVPAQGTLTHDLIDPANRRLLQTVICASREQRDRAVDAARVAHPGWARLAAETRAAQVAAIVDEIRQVAGALAERQVAESGQPLRECQDLVSSAVRRLRVPLTDSPAPTGVRVVRLPWQSLWPFWESALRSIAAGSTLVCELPADRAPGALAISRCAQRLPPGVLNVVTVEADAEPATRPDIAREFVFVGQDANLDVAVAGATALRLYNTGQREGQSARIHVETSLAYRFADRLHEYLAFLEAGDPRKPITDLGPLVCEAALHQAAERIGHALKQGALVKLGGREYQPWGLRGYFLQPTVLIEGTGVERAPHETISGPVVIVSPTADIGFALRESTGESHAPLRLSAFSGQAEKLERSLRAAAFQPQPSAYADLVDRAWSSGFPAGMPVNTVNLEMIEAPQKDWFPYQNRRGMKL